MWILTSLSAAIEKSARSLDRHCSKSSIGDLCRTVSSSSISLNLVYREQRKKKKKKRNNNEDN